MDPSDQLTKLDFELVEHEADYIVKLSAAGNCVEARFKLELLSENTLAGKNIDLIAANRCPFEDINMVGGELLRALTGGPIRETYEKICAAASQNNRVLIRLSLPARLRELPWEALYDDHIGSLAASPSYSILRNPPPRAPIPPFVAGDTEALSMLCVIPSGSRLDTELELNNIRHAGKHLEEPLELKEMVDRVVPDDLRGALQERRWDIVHYVGHGRVQPLESGPAGENKVQVRLHDEDGEDYWIDAEIFAELFRETGVRLVVLNCCSGDTPSPTRYLSGMGPYLMRAGVPAVVAMRYEIGDRVAIRFSNSLYQNLFAGKLAGQVDAAVEAARTALLLNKQPGSDRGFITPVLYLADGYEQLFKLQPPPRAVTKTPDTITTVPTFSLPPSLREAFEKGNCVPVVGPAILRFGLFRRGAQSPLAGTGPRELAENLAKQRPYVGFDEDQQVGDRAGEWMSTWLLHLVCQYYQDQDDRNRGNLLTNVLKVFQGLEPNDTIRSLMKWKVPGLFYTYFDGLMEQCLNGADAHLNAIVRSVTDPPIGDTRAIVNQRPLVLLRGSWTDPDSLVLTEEDNEALLESLRRMHATLSGLTRQIGRSVLFLGVSPRDPLVRALSQQLLETGNKRKQGPTFFVWPRPNPADAAYWRRYGIVWIDHAPDEVIEAVNCL